jgi:hypothetical protein
MYNIYTVNLIGEASASVSSIIHLSVVDCFRRILNLILSRVYKVTRQLAGSGFNTGYSPGGITINYNTPILQ